MASRCWTVFSLRVRGTRIADIASDPQTWGSPRVDDDRNGPGAPVLSSFVFLDRTGTPTGNGEKQIGRAYGAPRQPSTLPGMSPQQFEAGYTASLQGISRRRTLTAR